MIKIYFLLVDHPVGRGNKKCNAKVDISVFLFVDFRFFFVLNIHLLVLIFSIILPLSGKYEVQGLPHGGRLHGLGRFCLPLQNEMRVFAR